MPHPEEPTQTYELSIHKGDLDVIDHLIEICTMDGVKSEDRYICFPIGNVMEEWSEVVLFFDMLTNKPTTLPHILSLGLLTNLIELYKYMCVGSPALLRNFWEAVFCKLAISGESALFPEECNAMCEAQI